jgi:GPH family glycoside/pentoside/hexuronide:cation symporter
MSETSAAPEEKLGVPEKVGYALGDTASCLYYQTFAMFLMIFYTDTFGLAPAAVGTMFLVTRIWDTAFDPIVGVLADRTETRFGKFRPWILFAILPLAVAGVLVFCTPGFSDIGKLVWAYCTYTFVMMAYSAINVPYGALLGVISPKSEQRTKLSSYRFLGAFSGNMIVQGTLLWLVATLGQGNKRVGYPLAFTVYAVLAAGMFFFTFAATRERVKPVKAKSAFFTDLKDLLHNRPWIVLALMGVTSLVYISIKSAAMMYFFKYYVGDEDAASRFMVTGTVFSLIGVAATPYFTKFLKGKKAAFIVLTIVVAICTAAFGLAGPKDFWIMYASQIVGSFFGGTLFPLMWAMYADTADYGEWKTGHRATGLVFSAATFSQKMGWTIGGWITGLILEHFGYVANQPQSAQTLGGIKSMMSTIPAIMCGVVVAIALLYNLDGKTQQKIEADLAAARKVVAP